MFKQWILWGWEAQSEFFLVLCPGWFSRLLYIVFFPCFLNQTLLYEDTYLSSNHRIILVERELRRSSAWTSLPCAGISCKREGPCNLSLLKVMRFPRTHFTSRPRSLWMVSNPSGISVPLSITDADTATSYLTFTVLLLVVQSITNLMQRL